MKCPLKGSRFVCVLWLMMFWHSSHQFPSGNARAAVGSQCQCHCHGAGIRLFGLERVGQGDFPWSTSEDHLRWYNSSTFEQIPSMSGNNLGRYQISLCFFPVFCPSPSPPPTPFSLSKILWECLICHIYRMTSCPNSCKGIILTMCSASSWTPCSRSSVEGNIYLVWF